MMGWPSEVCSIRQDPVKLQRDERDQTPWTPDPRVEVPNSLSKSVPGAGWLLAWKRTNSERAF